MSFQSGTYALSNGVVDYTIPFPLTFTSPPGAIIPAVFNIIDGSSLLLVATVTDKSETEFSVRLDGTPDSNNYVLGWMAGESALLYAAVITIGKKVTDITRASTKPVDADLIPFVSMSPLPASKAMTWEILRSAFVNYLADIPASANSAGITGQFAANEDFIFFRLTTGWVQIPCLAGSWLTANPNRPEREGVAALTAGEIIQNITFDTPFDSGDDPVVSVQIYNVAAGDKLVLSAMPIASSLSGFSVAMTAEPDTADYKIYYKARQLP